MTSTTNYGLNIVEGTDIVNPLTQFNPNFNSIDTIMKANADAAVSSATCIKSGTVHTVTRTNTDAEMFVFTASGDWNLGDTMTVDGTPVTPVLPDGSGLIAGSFLINSEVLCSLKGTKVTVYSNKMNIAITASEVEYSAGVSVEDRLKLTLVQEIPANTYADYGTALIALNAAFTALSNEDKLRSKIVRGDNIVYTCASTGGAYMTSYPSTTSMLTIETMFINSGIYIRSSFENNTASTTVAATSAQAQSLKLYLA